MNLVAESVIGESEASRPIVASNAAYIAGFFFSFRAVIVLASVHVLGIEPSSGAALSIGLDIALLIWVCFCALGAARDEWQSTMRLPAIRWVFVFLTVSVGSLAWSATVSLPTSIAYWCGMATDVAIVMVLLRNGSETEVAHSVMKGFIGSSCLLALVAWMMPLQSDLRLGDTDFFNTNQIGNLCAFSILLAQYLTRRNDGKWGAAMLLLSVTLLRSLSKTTIVAFLASECFLMVKDRSISRKTKVMLAMALVMVALVFWGLFAAYYDVYTNAGNQAETLTGRTGIWAYTLTAALEKPWIGNGFDSMWKVIPPFGPEQFEARHAENEFLQQFYTYGVAGVVMLCGIYGSLYWRIRRLDRGPVKLILTSMMIFILVRGFAEAEPFDLLLPLWSIVLLSVIVERGSVSLTPLTEVLR